MLNTGAERHLQPLAKKQVVTDGLAQSPLLMGNEQTPYRTLNGA